MQGPAAGEVAFHKAGRITVGNPCALGAAQHLFGRDRVCLGRAHAPLAVPFKRIGVDPAIAAGPLVTAGCDLLGVSIYLASALAIFA